MNRFSILALIAVAAMLSIYWSGLICPHCLSTSDIVRKYESRKIQLYLDGYDCKHCGYHWRPLAPQCISGDAEKKIRAELKTYDELDKEKAANAEKFMAVYAVRDIAAGATITSEDVGERKISRNEIPDGIVTQTKEFANRDENDSDYRPHSYYLTSKTDAVGRISLGVIAGQTLFYRYPGYRGTSVLLAKKDIPRGSSIRNDQLVCFDMHPRDIPKGAIALKSEITSSCSAGVLKGQTLIYSDQKINGKASLAGTFGDGPPKMKVCVYVIEPIAAGAFIRREQVRTKKIEDGKFAHMLVAPSDAIGRRAKYSLSTGQLIMDHDVLPK